MGLLQDGMTNEKVCKLNGNKHSHTGGFVIPFSNNPFSQ